MDGWMSPGVVEGVSVVGVHTGSQAHAISSCDARWPMWVLLSEWGCVEISQGLFG